MIRTRRVTVTAFLHDKEGRRIARAVTTFTVIQRYHWWRGRQG